MGDGLGAVRHAEVSPATHAGFDLADDGERILGARVVGSDDAGVAQTSGGGTHQRALAFVAVTAATEDGDEAARIEFPERAAGVFQRVRSVGVIDKHGGAAGVADVFHAAGNLRCVGECGDGFARTNATGVGGGDCRQQIVDIETADERGAHEKGSALCG